MQQNGLFLGMFPHAKYASVRVSISAGDWFALYTDGVSEAHGAGNEEFGIERLQALLAKTPDARCDAAADGVLDAVRSWTGRGAAESQDDDITLVVMRAEG